MSHNEQVPLALDENGRVTGVGKILGGKVKLDELTLGQVREIQAMCSIGTKSKKAEETGGDVKIVVLQRGWVVVGRFFQKGSKCRVENGYVIRRWGTTGGLGQLATQGPLTDTRLEPTPTIRFHELTVVQTIDCVEAKWAGKSSAV